MRRAGLRMLLATLAATGTGLAPIFCNAQETWDGTGEIRFAAGQFSKEVRVARQNLVAAARGGRNFAVDGGLWCGVPPDGADLVRRYVASPRTSASTAAQVIAELKAEGGRA